jgi:dehydrodolichyl diphosphate syntase complex subunit NUS1
MPSARTTAIYRQDAQQSGELLSALEREALIKPYLPTPKRTISPGGKRRSRPIRTFLKAQVYRFVFIVIHIFFSIYVRIRQGGRAILHKVSAILYYHHRTPELIRKDVKNLSRLPKHLSVILELQNEDRGGQGLDELLDNVAEISAWCASVGIPMLSVYEKTGILKSYIPVTHKTVASKLHAYFGKHRPSLQVRAPHIPSFLNGDVSEEDESPSNDMGGF